MAKFVFAAGACWLIPSLSQVIVPHLEPVMLKSRFAEPPRGQFELDKGEQYQMPILFGSRSPDATPTLEHPEDYNIFFRYEVDASKILPILPEQLQLLEPMVTVAFVQSSNLSWLSGRSYSSVTVSVPARYEAPDGTSTEGQFNLVEFVNLAEPMLLGRDLVGLPRVYANISLEKSQDGLQRVHVWYDQGPNGKTEFLTLDVTPPTRLSTELDRAPTRANAMNLRYFPSSVGCGNGASVSEIVNLPIDAAVSELAWGEHCHLMWTKPNTSAHDPAGQPGWFMMPTEWRFANALAEMPRRNVQCGVSHGKRSFRLDMASILYDLLQSSEGPSAGSAAPAPPPHGSFHPVAKSMEYRMPISFGGDRIDESGGAAYYPSTENLWLAYNTDVEALLPLVPSGLVLLNSWVVVGLTDAASVDWLAGRGYNMITVSVSVGYPMANGSLLESSICLVVWEDWSDCLITGREMSGVPKIWADIDFQNGTDRKAVRAAWGGLPFLEASIELGPLQRVSDQPKTMGHGFQWKYFPRPGAAGAEISELTDYPQESRLQSQANGTRCSITWLPGHPAGKPVTVEEVPEQHKVLNALAGLPIRGEPVCGLSNSEVWLRNDLSNVVVANFGQGAKELLV